MLTLSGSPCVFILKSKPLTAACTRLTSDPGCPCQGHGSPVEPGGPGSLLPALNRAETVSGSLSWRDPGALISHHSQVQRSPTNSAGRAQ